MKSQIQTIIFSLAFIQFKIHGAQTSKKSLKKKIRKNWKEQTPVMIAICNFMQFLLFFFVYGMLHIVSKSLNKKHEKCMKERKKRKNNEKIESNIKRLSVDKT